MNLENSIIEISMQKCTVGMFNLPGLIFDKEKITDELHKEMCNWSEENHCGTPMTEVLWSFRSEAKRDWFILRWSGTEASE